MPENLNNNVHRRDSEFPHDKSVQEDFVSLGVERAAEGGQAGINTNHVRNMVQWVRGHAVPSAVAGFVIGYFLGSVWGRRHMRAHSMEAL